MNEWTNKFYIKRVDEYDAITRRALRRIKLAKERKGPQRVENCRQMSRRCKERPRKRGEPTEAISIIVFNYRVARPPWLPRVPFLRGVVPLQKEAVPVPRACSATTRRRRSVEQCNRKQVFRASQMLGTLPVEHIVIRLRPMSSLSLSFSLRSFQRPWALYVCALRLLILCCASSLVFYRLTPMRLDELTTLMMSRRERSVSL